MLMTLRLQLGRYNTPAYHTYKVIQPAACGKLRSRDATFA